MDGQARPARCGRWSAKALVGAALLAAALGAPAEELDVVAQDAKAVWYAVDVTEFVQESYVNQCDRDLERLAPGVEAIVKTVRPRVVCTYRIPYADGLLEAYQERSAAEQAAPPSRRRPVQKIWAELVRKYPVKGACAKGFATEAHLGVPYVECVRSYAGKEACPLGGEIRVPDGRLVAFTDHPAERKCSRDTSACPAGSTALPADGAAGLSGCYRCPSGELDLVETQAWRRAGVRSARVLCRAERP